MNDRAPHLAAYGADRLIGAWETSTAMVSFPDGSVAFVAPGSSATKLKILRVLPCGG